MNYKEALLAAMRTLDRIRACTDCLQGLQSDLAVYNASKCNGCALLVAEGLEGEWSRQNDLVCRLAIKFASVFRKYLETSDATRDIFRNWDTHLARHEKGDSYHPQEVRSARVKEALRARMAFWEAVRELHRAVPDEEIKKWESSAGESAASDAHKT